MIGTESTQYRDVATTPQMIRGMFVQRQAELTQLATFLTGDTEVAQACVVDACSSMEHSYAFAGDMQPVSPTAAVIQSAADMLRSRIAQLSFAYENQACGDAEREPTACPVLELMLLESAGVRLGVDTVGRFVLAIRDTGKGSSEEAAAMLGMSRWAVEAAYSAAVDALEAVECAEPTSVQVDDETAWN